MMNMRKQKVMFGCGRKDRIKTKVNVIVQLVVYINRLPTHPEITGY